MEEYKYKDYPITPAIIEDLIIQLFNGQRPKRHEIVKKILDYHINNGGRRPDAKNFTASVKKALSKLRSKNFAQKGEYSFWIIQKQDTPVVTVDTTLNNPLPCEEIQPISIYGNGNNTVYLYYYPTYKKYAELLTQSTWQCKIGKTDRDLITRILSQASTALPEKPVVEFIIKIDDASLLENMIHSALTLKRKKVNNSPGTEWFDTNPNEVLEIIKSVNPQILNSTPLNSI